MSFLYKYIVKSNLFISICACCFYLSGKVLFEEDYIRMDWGIILLLILGTFLIYHISQKPFKPGKESQTRSNYEIVIALMITIALIWLALRLDLKYLILFSILGFLSLSYNSLAFSNVKFLPLRSIPLLKIFIISFVWASIGIILPYFELGTIGFSKLILLFITQILFIFAITLPFDIRDFYKDYKHNLKTVPGIIGISNTKKLAYILLATHYSGICLINCYHAFLYLPVILVSIYLVKKSSLYKPNYYYTFYIDGLILLQFLSFYFSERLFL